MPSAVRRLIVQRGNALTAMGKLLESYSYKGVLERGFALIVDDQGHIVRSKAAVRPGQSLAVEVADGQFGASVSGAPVSRKKPRPPRDDGGQESLF
jgi:exodeoxyribonuclease VII large subunit